MPLGEGSPVEPGSWQLAAGHYQGYLDLAVVYPRPDNETSNYARHRHAYPGIKYEIPIGVMFGKWPYKYEMIEGPEWLSVEDETLQFDTVDKFIIPDGYGILSGIAPSIAADPANVVVRVYDQDHNRPSPSYVDVQFSVEVSPDNFVFVDVINGNEATATGTIDAPYKEVHAVRSAGGHGGKIMVMRQTPALTEPQSEFGGGYIPASTSRILTFSDKLNDPQSCINYPGESVIFNDRQSITSWSTADAVTSFAFANSGDPDVFLSGFTVAYSAQDNAQNGRNVRVISVGGSNKRFTAWGLGFLRPHGGRVKNDNHGAIFGPAGTGTNTYSARDRTYVVECWGNWMNHPDDLGDEASFSGRGSNGPHLAEFYSTSRSLIERCTVSNSHLVNNLFLGPKGVAVKFEVRACDTTIGNTGENRHIRTTGFGVPEPEVNWQRGLSNRLVWCYNKTGDLSDGGSCNFGDNTSAPDQPENEHFYTYRNSVTDAFWSLPAHDPKKVLASRNVGGAVQSTYIDEENVTGTRSEIYDANINLKGEYRVQYLGTHGAEVSNGVE